MHSNHYNIYQLRIDLWNSLKEICSLIPSQHLDKKHSSKIKEIQKILINLRTIENYFSFPGTRSMEAIEKNLELKDYTALSFQVTEIVRLLVSENYKLQSDLSQSNWEQIGTEHREPVFNNETKYFEVLFIEELSENEGLALKQKIKRLHDPNSNLVYDVLIQHSFQDALIALLFNYNIQAACIRYAPAKYAKGNLESIKPYIHNVLKIDLSNLSDAELGPLLGNYIHQFRPELDIYYITDSSLNDLKDDTLKSFNRIFYRMEDIQELHLSILSGLNERLETPFFSALKNYSEKPISVFHALPISRGNSVFKSRWIQDFGNFYGRNVFLAESSATNGGLDSLLQPQGPLKRAQEKAALAYGAEHTFFVTNGTSTANKIVQQALIQPGDVVLVDRDCHKSHHYGLVLAGAFPAYLDSYPIEAYCMYGAVPLSVIIDKLISLKKASRLDKVKMLLLTNCTFDGLVYNVEKVMEAVLAIKPDMIFLWDEAWFAFASFTYTYNQRTGMYVAKKLFQKYKSEAYRETYKAHISKLKSGEIPKLPDPDQVKIRVYATQSTHKTLSSFRQGSMIQIWDEEFSRKVADNFQEAYMTHTTTSPNYQILASLDVGRMQVELEGYELVEKSIEMAMILRSKILDHPKLSKYFNILNVKDLIPKQYRLRDDLEYYSIKHGWDRMESAWEMDEFVLDPTKITLYVGRAGITGDAFKNKFLMDGFNIQVNKTSRNTVLLMTNIGTTRSSITLLINALLQIADQLDESKRALNKRETEIYMKHLNSLIKDVPPLPDFSYFHTSFQASPGVPGGNIREAFFLAYNEDFCEYISIQDGLEAIRNKKELVSTSFVIPYPPGFPILVPGQVVSEGIIKFMIALDVKEVHGYKSELGLKIFTAAALNRKNTISAMGALQTFMSNEKKKIM